jgi:hypothetical protein
LVGSKRTLAAIWPKQALERLASAWIETPFQLVSIAATPSGIETLHEVTGIPIEEVRRLVDQSAALLTDGERSQVAVKLPTEEMPLGALKPKR